MLETHSAPAAFSSTRGRSFATVQWFAPTLRVGGESRLPVTRRGGVRAVYHL